MEKVSIILAFRDEEQTIKECLNSLVAQTYENKEIILVDDSSTDKSTGIAKEFLSKYDFLKYFKIEHRDELQEWPRIQGVKHVTGEILFMAEADAKYEENYLEACAKHLGDERVGGVVGKLNVWGPKTFISKFKTLSINPRFEDENNMKKELTLGNIAVWVFRKSVFEECGGYGNGYYGEERNLSKRMIACGYGLVYEPNTRWWHRWKEHVVETIINYFHFGRKMYTLNKSNKNMVLKNIYFLLPFILVMGAMFFNVPLVLLLLHFLALEKSGLKLFLQSKHTKFRNYALLAPLVSYLQNIPFALGFFYGALVSRG